MSNKSESVHEHVENMHRLDSGSSAPSERVTMTMMIFSLYIALNATIATFDSGYGGTVLLMASFNNAYGPCHELPDPQTGAVVEICQVTALQQSLISLTPLFIAVGSILSGVVGNYFGRRGTIQAGSLAVLRCRGNVGRSGKFCELHGLQKHQRSWTGSTARRHYYVGGGEYATSKERLASLSL
jgi:hypothetical protein